MIIAGTFNKISCCALSADLILDQILIIEYLFLVKKGRNMYFFEIFGKSIETFICSLSSSY
jgi:hypothetical protein